MHTMRTLTVCAWSLLVLTSGEALSIFQRLCAPLSNQRMSRAIGRSKKTSGKLAPAKSKEAPGDTSRTAPSAKRQKLFDLAICLGLILSTLAVYAQVRSFDFVNYDDDQYVYQNAHVQAGLTSESVKWALTAVVVGNWMPVTLLSHLLDVQLFGMQSGMQHSVNVLFHALSAVLLFLALRRATGARALSAFVAFVFGLHPLHVGSVAWIAERKDVLSTFFWFLALYEYVRYTERRSLVRYLAVAAPFCLGLMSKPMLVTFPFTLLLFDVWPLRRTQWPGAIWEKLPLIALSIGAASVTYFLQRTAGIVLAIPLGMRIGNALLSYVTYIGQMFWPLRLSVFYPYPSAIPVWEAVAALAVILAVSVLAMRAWRTRPYLAVGWLWYLGTLAPVIGLLQAGRQAHADRYMYIPMVGLLIMLAWGAADVFGKWPRTKAVAAVAGVAYCAACMALAWRETAYWQNSETLYEHAIDSTGSNDLAENNLGLYRMTMQRYAEAIPHFEAALRISPDNALAHFNLGVCLSNIAGRTAEAIPQFEAALRISPNNAVGHFDLGVTLSNTPGRTADAIQQYEAALRLNPDYAEAHNNLGAALIGSGNCAAAIPHLEAAIRANPNYAGASYNLGYCQMAAGNYAAAIPYFEAAIRAKADFADAHRSLGELLARLGRTEEAIAHLDAAQRSQPDPAVAAMLDRLRAGQARRGVPTGK
jgi:protein O-mannosyl-transferase